MKEQSMSSRPRRLEPPLLEQASAMSRGGGSRSSTGQPSCATVPLGKYVLRALRAATGKRRVKDKTKKKRKPPKEKELTSSFSAEAGAARRESVVRSGVVEVYRGVVLACTVIRNHPPGLCLAHPDVFRNPHGAVVRPLEPLFPGQKFLLRAGSPWRRAWINRRGRERRGGKSAVPAGFRTFAMPRRTWEPSLPSVGEEDEEEDFISPYFHPPSEARTDVHEQQ